MSGGASVADVSTENKSATSFLFTKTDPYFREYFSVATSCWPTTFPNRESLMPFRAKNSVF